MAAQLTFLLLLLSLTLSIYGHDGSQTESKEPLGQSKVIYHTENRPVQPDSQTNENHVKHGVEEGVFNTVVGSLRTVANKVQSMVFSSEIPSEGDRDSGLGRDGARDASHDQNTLLASLGVSADSVGNSKDRTYSYSSGSNKDTDSSNINNIIVEKGCTINLIESWEKPGTDSNSQHIQSSESDSTDPSSQTSSTGFKREEPVLGISETVLGNSQTSDYVETFKSSRKLLWARGDLENKEATGSLRSQATSDVQVEEIEIDAIPPPEADVILDTDTDTTGDLDDGSGDMPDLPIDVDDRDIDQDQLTTESNDSSASSDSSDSSASSESTDSSDLTEASDRTESKDATTSITIPPSDAYVQLVITKSSGVSVSKREATHTTSTAGDKPDSLAVGERHSDADSPITGRDGEYAVGTKKSDTQTSEPPITRNVNYQTSGAVHQNTQTSESAATEKDVTHPNSFSSDINGSFTQAASTSTPEDHAKYDSIDRGKESVGQDVPPSPKNGKAIDIEMLTGSQHPNDSDLISNEITGVSGKSIVASGLAERPSSRPRRPVPHIDLNTRALYYLRSQYKQCDTCMEKWSSNRSRTQCPTYVNEVLEFEKWAKEFANVLRYGCDGQGFTMESRCCHAPQREVSVTISQMAQVSKNLATMLRDQCYKCPVDCFWYEWSAWSQCPPPTCAGLPPVYRTRTREAYQSRYGGRDCHGSATEQEECPTTPRVVGTWHSWQPWSACTGSCDGIQTRRRTCTDPTLCFTPCRGDRLDWRKCGDSDSCCSQREWTNWGAWSLWASEPLEQSRWLPARDSDMRVASRTRHRSCEADNRNGGRFLCPDPCVGEDVETEKCIESFWSEWSHWSACTGDPERYDADTREPCGTGLGTQRRCRTCRRGTCGDTCEGDAVEYNTGCYLKPCCESPVWTEWGSWSECNARGYKVRRRMCHPDPNNWGSPTCRNRPCPGSEETFERCGAAQALAQECTCTRREWTYWSEWSPCGSRPGESRRIRTRHRSCEGDSRSREPWCPNSCPGDDMVTEDCCTESVWGQWSAWSPCSSDTDRQDHDTGEMCGTGVGHRNRTRTCIRGTCGKSCEGNNIEHNLSCYRKPCCELPQLSAWSQWGECSSENELRQRVQIRRRTCQPNPDKWGFPVCTRDTECDRPRRESRPCKCEIPQWGSWGTWSGCDFRNRLVTRSRARTCMKPSADNPDCGHMCCPGKDVERGQCYCRKARYTRWGRFQDCKYNAGMLMMRRYRTCRKFDNPGYCDTAPYSWRNCVGRLMQEVPCCESYWSDWRDFGHCNAKVKDHPAKFVARDCLWKEDCSSNLTKRLAPKCLGPRIDLIRCTPKAGRHRRSAPLAYPEVPENECEGRSDGIYPSQQHGCTKFIVCLDGEATETNDCPPYLVFDSVCQMCLARSATCNPERHGFDRNRFKMEVPEIHGPSRSRCLQDEEDLEEYLEHTWRRKEETKLEEPANEDVSVS